MTAMTALITIRDKDGRKLRFNCTLEKRRDKYYWMISYPYKERYDCIFYTTGDKYYGAYPEYVIFNGCYADWTNLIPFEEWHLSKWAKKYNDYSKRL